MCMCQNFEILPHIGNGEQGIPFVKHQLTGRSGHLGHALVEYSPGSILAFYSNDSGVRNHGHNGFGWVEYKRSTDGGKSWSDPYTLEYSRKAFLEGVFTVCCEKAVVNKAGEIVLFCLRCSQISNAWEPLLEPTVLISSDMGESWSKPILLGNMTGRIYDTVTIGNDIYCLFESGVFTCEYSDPHYFMYKSIDGGKSFDIVGTLPFEIEIKNTDKRFGFALAGYFYGALSILPDGALAAFVYNEDDEYNMEYCVSYNGGKEWSDVKKSYCAKRIRNPQIGKLGGTYFLHGRSGSGAEMPNNFIIYYSSDSINWDDGTYVTEPCRGGAGSCAYYSNNLVVTEPDGEQRLLIQTSVPYCGACTDVTHWWIEKKKDKTSGG